MSLSSGRPFLTARMTLFLDLVVVAFSSVRQRSCRLPQPRRRFPRPTRSPWRALGAVGWNSASNLEEGESLVAREVQGGENL